MNDMAEMTIVLTGEAKTGKTLLAEKIQDDVAAWLADFDVPRPMTIRIYTTIDGTDRFLEGLVVIA